MANNVLVLGAGELGLAVLESLATHPKKNNTKLSVLIRQSSIESTAPEKQEQVQHLKSLNIEIEPGDVVQQSVAELASIFQAYDTIVSCNGMSMPSGTQLKLTEAVLQAQVQRYFPWQFGMDYDIIGQGSSQDLFDEQLAVRKQLRAQERDDGSATEWTIVSTGLFMSFLFVPAFGVVDIEDKVVRGLGSWENKITLTLPEDIGRITADVVLDPRGIRNQVVYTAGDTLSYGQIADLVEERFGREAGFRRELWDLDTLAKQMEAEASVMVKYRNTFAQGKGVAWEKEDTENVKRGLKTKDVKAYLAEMKE